MELRGVSISQKTIDTFWNKVEIRGEDDCWIWQAGKNSRVKGHDYGLFWIPELGKGLISSRLALSFHLKIDIGFVEVRHTCDNPPCCNPKHLISGTHLENMRDMYEKNRRITEEGEKRYNAKLNNEKVKEIRRLFALREKYKIYNKAYLARLYGVDSGTIRAIIKRTAWKHVGD